MSVDIDQKQAAAIDFPLPSDEDEGADTPDEEVLTATPDTALTPDPGDEPAGK